MIRMITACLWIAADVLISKIYQFFNDNGHYSERLDSLGAAVYSRRVWAVRAFWDNLK